MKSFQAGKWAKRDGYRSFEPSLINRPWILDDPQILEALSRADRQIGRLDMFSEYVPNLDLFVQMHVTKEATPARSAAHDEDYAQWLLSTPPISQFTL